MNFPNIEKEILKFWKENNIFKKTLEKESKKGDFIFYDGPPFATGLPHYGHIIAGTIKDIIPRYRTMKGWRVKRRWGWDCHGLPLENLIEKEKGIKSKQEIENDIAGFNKSCRNSVLRYAREWKSVVERVGRWVDMDNDYKTMENKYIEVIWWIFKELYKEGLIYEGYKSMHLCPRCETTLSNFEVTLGYKEVKDIAVTVKFKIKPGEEKRLDIESGCDVYFLAWTTTPWTLPGNTALAVGGDIIYQLLKIKDLNGIYIMAKERVDDIISGKEYEVIKDIDGARFEGIKYETLFDFSLNHIKDSENFQNAFRVYLADFVSTNEGTGIVHVAPAFGEDDYSLSLKYNIPFLQHIGFDGRFKQYTGEFAGMRAREKDDGHKTDIEIIKYLNSRGKLFSKGSIRHSYPFCWRCDSPLLNYSASSWFVRVVKIKDRLIKANEGIRWVPEHIKNGRFGKWLEGARDWAISRQRYWGASIPVWRCEDLECGNAQVIGSKKELIIRSGLKDSDIKDLHRPYIDEIVLKCDKCGRSSYRIKEVFDCWFESGSMPYASELLFSDYEIGPDTSRSDLLKHISFPADFIAEGIDQTRGWFYTLIVLGTALYNKSPFKNVIVNGIILAEDGRKMSKRFSNYTDPVDIMEKYGADALRFYLMSSAAVRGETTNFSDKGVEEVYRKVVLLSLNILRFFKMFASNSLKIEKYNLGNILDQWIVLRLKQTASDVDRHLNNYEIDKSCRPLLEFIDDLSTWYLRRSRERFKRSGSQESKLSVETLGFVLFNLSKILAPITPFLSEYIYREIKPYIKDNLPQSVHLEDWPSFGTIEDNDLILDHMDEARSICEIGHSLRSENKIKVRQVLRKFSILKSEYQSKSGLFRSEYLTDFLNIIKDELNVKKASFVEEIPDRDNWVSKDGVYLYIKIDDELKKEGVLREIVRNINFLRKRNNFTINDKAYIKYNTDSDLIKSVIDELKKDLKSAVLADKIEYIPNLDTDAGSIVNIEGNKLIVDLKKT